MNAIICDAITNEEADERLINVLQHYVNEREMPIRVAKCLMKSNIKNPHNLKSTWKQFLQTIKTKA
jgi:hypothetical protein